MKIYKFRKYESVFPKLFNNEKRRIKGVLPKDCSIEHIGSTAVLGLAGKGVIDIMVLCPMKEINLLRDRLIKKGYKQGLCTEKGRIYLKRETRINGKERRFHVHVTLDPIIWKRAINFKNYLTKNPKVSKQYVELKKKAIVKCKGDGETYMNLKNKFIQYHIKKAFEI